MEVIKGGEEYYNKGYIKLHPYYLFIFEDTLKDEEFEEYSNTFPIPTYTNDGKYFKDDDLEINKKSIKDSIRDILKAIERKKVKKIILPELTIGKGFSKLNEKQPKTYSYIKQKIKELLDEIENMNKEENRHRDRNGRSRHRNGRSRRRNGRSRHRNGRSRHRNGRSRHRNGISRHGRSLSERHNHRRHSRHRNRGYNYHEPKSRTLRKLLGDSDSSYDNRRHRRRLTRKKMLRQKKEKKQRTIRNVDEASKYALRRCNSCIKLKKLLKKPSLKGEKKGSKHLKELERAERKCVQCQKLCNYLDENLKKGMENYDIYSARYPKICTKDKYGIKRVEKLGKSYREKMLDQIEQFDLDSE